MVYLLAVVLAIVNALALATVIIGLPGNWFMLVFTGLFAWWGWDQSLIGGWTLLLLLALALLAELVEFAAGMAGAARAGGGWRGSLGALVGGIVGGVIGLLLPPPVVAALIGSCAGAGLGAYLLERRGQDAAPKAKRIGWSAGMGRLWGTLGKLALGGLIWVLATLASFWP